MQSSLSERDEAKFRIKVWEAKYKEANGCCPDRDALHSAPDDIRRNYRIYRNGTQAGKLSTETFSVKPNHERTQSDDKKWKDEEIDADGLQQKAKGNIFPDSPDTSVPTGKSCGTDTWGSHLNKSNVTEPAIKKSTTSSQSLYSMLASRLRTNETIFPVKGRMSLKHTPSTTDVNFRPSDKFNMNKCSDNDRSKLLNEKSEKSVESMNNLNPMVSDDSVLKNCLLPIADTVLTANSLEKDILCTSNLLIVSTNRIERTRSLNMSQNVGRKVNSSWLVRCLGEEIDLVNCDNAEAIIKDKKNQPDERVFATVENETEKISTINLSLIYHQQRNDDLIPNEIAEKLVHAELETSNFSESSKVLNCDSRPKGSDLLRKKTVENQVKDIGLKADILTQRNLRNVSKQGKLRGVDSNVILFDENKSCIDNVKQCMIETEKRTGKRKRRNCKHIKESESAVPDAINPMSVTKTTEYVNSPTINFGEAISYTGNIDIGQSKEIEKPRSTGSKKARIVTSKNDSQRKKKLINCEQNFVKINLKKKIFVRGKKTMTGSKFRRQEWKKKQSGKSEGSGEMKCFTCGIVGHWMRNCPSKKSNSSLTQLEEYNEDESTFLSLEEAADLAKGIRRNDKSVTQLFTTNPDTYKEASISENIETQSDLALLKSDINHTLSGDLTDDFDVAALSIDMSSYDELSVNNNLNNKNVKCKNPIYTSVDGRLCPTPDEVYQTLKLFGYSSFRSGQEMAVMRILSGLSTLLVFPTGAGKSLCYQLPAYLYAQKSHCITICVSPLVSLMEDQVTGLPSFLKAVCLHTQQSEKIRNNAIMAIRSGLVHILLLSPEAIVASGSGGVMGTLIKELPPVAFACVDEAHCMSEWSHNFRPSYLRICQVLRDKFSVKTILGLTATARHQTSLSIARHLQLDDLENGIIMDINIPNNLILSVSRDKYREEALLTLLQGDRFSLCHSIIIYCTRREVCEHIATLIRTNMQSKGQSCTTSGNRKQLSVNAEAYHAGLTGYRRQQVQKLFMSGKLRIVVATVAFGMGIDKVDLHGVIHYNMPKNIESYVQEIGRAGRDGLPSHCHLFLDSVDGRDVQELKRHIYSDSMDRHVVRKLLSRVFQPCLCVKLLKLDIAESMQKQRTGESADTSTFLPNDDIGNEGKINTSEKGERINQSLLASSNCPGHEVAVPIEELVVELDLPVENIETLLCYLEFLPGQIAKLRNHVYATCSISCYHGSKQLRALSHKCPPLAAAIALEREKGVNLDSNKQFSFPVVNVASRMGWNSPLVKRELKALEFANGRKSGAIVTFSDLAILLEVKGMLSEEERDFILDEVYKRTVTRETDQLSKLQFIYDLLNSVSHSTVLMCCDEADLQRCQRLRCELQRYFSPECNILSDVLENAIENVLPETKAQVCSDVRAMLSLYSDHSWTGRAIAKIFHGIGSPNYPAQVWGRVHRFWRQHLNVDFKTIVHLCTNEIFSNRN